jgi:hypothetical protein
VICFVTLSDDLHPSVDGFYEAMVLLATMVRSEMLKELYYNSIIVSHSDQQSPTR